MFPRLGQGLSLRRESLGLRTLGRKELYYSPNSAFPPLHSLEAF